MAAKRHSERLAGLPFRWPIRQRDARRDVANGNPLLLKGPPRRFGVGQHEVRAPVAQQVAHVGLDLDRDMGCVHGRRATSELEHRSEPCREQRRMEPGLHDDLRPARKRRGCTRAEGVYDVYGVLPQSTSPAPGKAELGREEEGGLHPGVLHVRRSRGKSTTRSRRGSKRAGSAASPSAKSVMSTPASASAIAVSTVPTARPLGASANGPIPTLKPIDQAGCSRATRSARRRAV